MRLSILGYQKLDFEGQNGQHVNGTNYFTAFPEENVTGFRTDRFYARNGIPTPKDIKLNEEYEFVFDRKGHVERIEALTK